MSKDIEEARQIWAKVAKENGWYTEPFYVQIWKDKEGNILDSVSCRGMTKDIILEEQ